jgi:hypothetical protein
MVQASTTVLLGIFATVALGLKSTPILPSSRRQAPWTSSSIHQSLAIRATAAAHRPSPDWNNDDVQVYDAAFSPVACKVIHALALEHSLASNSDTCIFLRPPFNVTALTPLEHAMDSALTALNDTSGRIVEYWSRDEYMNIDAHVDIDENALEEDGILRYPEVAHILYLEVKKGMRGPTCIFPEKRIGWGVDHQSTVVDLVPLVMVPPVQGRIVRFPGSVMHTVPCPVNRWLLTDEEEQTLRYEEVNEDDDDEDYYEDDDDDDDDDREDDYDDDEEEDDEEVERSVLLFNTWSDEGPPPRDVKTGYETALSISEGEQRLIEEWEQDYGVDANWIRCNPVSKWNSRTIVESKDCTKETNEEGGDSKVQPVARVHLMGEQNRRLYSEKMARFHVPDKHVFQDALNQELEVTRLHLKEER